MKSKKKILVGLSGGVDSAVAAYLLKGQGYDVTAGFMINYLAPEGEVCPTREDIRVAKEVAEYLEIPFFTFDYREEYEKKVLDYMYEGYKKGITPNPDIMCNSEIKFRVFLDEALELGFDAVATGHYARIVGEDRDAPHPNLLLKEKERATEKIWIVENYNTVPKYIIELSRNLRKTQTDTEKFMWEILRGRKFHNLKFRRQYAFWRYIADFYCHEKALVIEIDGKIHESQKEYDQIRDEVIKQYGVTILRIKNEEIENDIQNVLHKIVASSSPSGEELRWGELCEQKTYHLLKWLDPNKDQSYFLAGLSQEQLSRALFPIGHLQKSEVRGIARKAGLPNAERKESQGICFVGKVDIKEFLQKKIPNSIGEVYDTSWKYIGKHKGVFYYTIGQRKGLDIGGMPEPIFVVNKDIKNNRLIVGYGKDEELYSDTLEIDELHFLASPRPSLMQGGESYKCHAKIRYRQADQSCEIRKIGNRYAIHFQTPQRAIASGQIIAFYDGDELWGSGVIL